MLTGLVGCTTLPPRVALLWPHLQPYDDTWQEAQEQLIHRASDRTVREKILQFVREKITKSHLSWKDQMRLAMFVGAVQSSATSNETSAICDTIRSGTKHPTFYAYINNDFAPAYFLCAIELFRYKTYPVRLFNPDGGSLATTDVVPMHLDQCQQTTGQMMPADYETWKAWWTTEGRLLNYDKSSQKYVQNHPAEGTR